MTTKQTAQMEVLKAKAELARAKLQAARTAGRDMSKLALNWKFSQDAVIAHRMACA